MISYRFHWNKILTDLAADLMLISDMIYPIIRVYSSVYGGNVGIKMLIKSVLHKSASYEKHRMDHS